eukprot:GHVH01004304.1.p1 GENE.GHVH01004304.1~~GHVH01004304.1.p1  ORF type:complete len:569 (-),score=72.99 GHVH01004304.1:1459-3165(-)
MRIDQFFILTGRGDSLVNKIYKRGLPRGCADMYYRQVQFGHLVMKGDRMIQQEGAPIFVHENLLKFIHLQRNNLYFVAVVDKDYPLCENVLSWINAFCKIVKDFLGNLCEDSVHSNTALLYELLDETVDPNGNFKSTDNLLLKSRVYSIPTLVNQENSNFPSQILSSAAGAISSAVTSSGLDLGSFKRTFDSFMSPKTLPAYASHRPIITSDRSNEVFLDLIESISVVLNPDCSPLRAFIHGNMLVKSFINWTTPIKLKIQFPEGLVIGRKRFSSEDRDLGGIYPPSLARPNEVVLDSAIFSSSVDTKDLAISKTVYAVPHVGEETLMSYRIGHKSLGDHIPLPIKFTTELKRVRQNYMELTVNLSSNSSLLKGGAGSVIAMISFPPELVGVSCRSVFTDSRTSKMFTTISHPDGDQASNGQNDSYWEEANTRVSMCDFERDKSRVVWKIPKFNAHEVGSLKIEVDIPSDRSSQDEVDALMARIGPMKLYFDLPSFTASRLQIASLKLIDTLSGKELDPMEPIDGSRNSYSAAANTNNRANLVKAKPNHYRWVRYLTKGTNYICHLGL